MSAMTEPPMINFLPAWYAERRGQARRRQRHLIFCGALVLAMAWAWLGLRAQGREVEARKTALQQRATAVDAQVQRLAELRAERHTLAERIERYRQVARPIDLHRISAVLADLTPPPIFLRGLSTEVISRKRAPSSDRNADAGSAKPEEAETVRLILIEIEGAAPSNVEVANYVGRLSAAPLFRNVKMVHARHGELGRVETRQFKITMEVPLDRRYRFAHKGADHAD